MMVNEVRHSYKIKMLAFAIRSRAKYIDTCINPLTSQRMRIIGLYDVNTFQVNSACLVMLSGVDLTKTRLSPIYHDFMSLQPDGTWMGSRHGLAPTAGEIEPFRNKTIEEICSMVPVLC